MKHEFFINGKLPDLNDIIEASKVLFGKGKKRPSTYSKMKKEWTTAVVRIIREHNLPKMERISVSFVFIEPNMKRDFDNIDAGKKFILDALVASGVIKDDNWKHIVPPFVIDFAVSKDHEGVCVIIDDEPDLQKLVGRCMLCDNKSKRGHESNE